MIWVKISLCVVSLVVLSYCNVIYDPKSFPEGCLKRAVDADYIPRGHIVNIGNLPVYEAADNLGSRRVLIAIYDIFGLSHPNMKQITDHMALQNNGFRTIMPDFFRGESWDLNVPINPVELAAFLQRVGDWNNVVRPDLINIVQYYRNLGVEEFAIFGMCWGGQIAALSAIELFNEFRASATVHPSGMTK